MASVESVQRKLQTTFKIDYPGEDLANEHMSKIIKWAVLVLRKDILFFSLGNIM